MNKYFVSRQIYWPESEYTVEIASGGLNFANPDMLCAKFAGEGKEYTDPREAVEAAINIRNAWSKITDESIGVAHGCTGGMTMPFEASEESELHEWAEKEYEKLPKCSHCGDLLGKEKFCHDFSDGDLFCSENCAETNYWALCGDDVG